MSYAQARDTLSYYGIYIHATSPVTDAGTQKVSSQSIQPGCLVGHGSIVEVTLFSDDDSMLGRY